MADRDRTFPKPRPMHGRSSPETRAARRPAARGVPTAILTAGLWAASMWTAACSTPPSATRNDAANRRDVVREVGVAAASSTPSAAVGRVVPRTDPTAVAAAAGPPAGAPPAAGPSAGPPTAAPAGRGETTAGSAAPLPADADALELVENAVAARATESAAAPAEEPIARLIDALADHVRALRAGDPAAARAALDAAAARFPDAAAPAWFRARLAIAEGRLAEAAADLDAVAARGGRHPALAVLRGRVALATGNITAGLSMLGDAIETGDGSVEAAQALAQWLMGQERHADSLAALQQAQRRTGPDARLTHLRVAILYETWQLDAAEAAARTWASAQPDDLIVRWQLVDLARARGDTALALERLEALGRESPADLDAAVGADRFATMRDELRAAIDSGRTLSTPRDLLARIRGDADESVRLEALKTLLSEPATREAALQVAWAQDDLPLLRITAVRAFDPAAPEFAARLEAGLGDPAAIVRASAARRFAELPRPPDGAADPAIRLLLAALDAEEDPYAFELMHQALAARIGPRVRSPIGGFRDPAARERIRDEWRKNCPE